MGQERRIVTVLFADLVGSTRLGSEEDPEEVRALMSRYYDAARLAVAEHDGTIEKFIGDAVMAVFGLPRAHGDDAARALATALALRDRVGSDDRLSRLQVKFGVATGEVVGSRDTARGEFLVTGDAVNVAARLQATAEPGEVVVTDRTAWDARAQFEFGPSTQLEIRGRPQPVMVRTLIGPVGVTRLQPNVAFVGRLDELDQLTLTARRTFRDRIPAVVSIVAPAGTGKTRLVEEFLASRLPDLAANARIETAQCLPYGGQLTYWPLRSVLYSLAGLDGDASGRLVLEAINAWLGDRRDAELLAATVGAENAASADPTELFSAWRAAFARAASAQALVIVFEDLHWSSDSLLDLVEFVMDPREPVPILIIAIARPELIDRRPAWGGGRRNFVSIYLDPLPEADIAALVGPLLEGASEEVVRQVVSRSEGNPFFAGELAQAAVERGAEGLPDTVQATVLARIDLLEDDQRRLLQVASIFGRTFRPEGLAAIDPGLDGRRPEMVDSLIARDLIRRQDAEHLAFRHILIRDVAYSTLPKSERSRLHAAAGDWFEARAAGREEEVAEIVALHYREAVMSAGARAPAGAELRGKAARWLLLAADSAISAAATREAEAHLRAALEFVEDPGEAAEIWAHLAEVLRLLPGGFEANQHAVELAREPAQRLSAIAGLLISGMRYARLSFTPEQIAVAIAEGKSLLEVVDDRALKAKFLAALGFQPNWAQAHGVEIPEETLREALDSAARAADLGEELDDPNLISTALDALDSCAMYMGDWDAVLVHALRRREYGSRLSLHELMDADHMATWAFMTLGDPQSAEGINAQSSARLKAGQAPEWRLSTICWAVRIAYTLGHWSEALETADQALALWRQLGSPLLGWVRVGFRPALLVARGRGDRIRAEALSDAFRSSLYELGTLAYAYDQSLVNEDMSGLERAVMAARTGAFGPLMIQDGLRQLIDAGQDCTRIAEKISSRLGDVPLLAPQLLRVRGLALNDAALLDEALRIAREYSDVPTSARLLVELGRMKDDAALVDEGCALLLAMGDVLQLERYGLS